MVTDELTPTERELMVELFRLGQAVSSYVLRAMGADAALSEPITSKEEFDLGARMAELGAVLRVRAAERGSGVVKDDGATKPPPDEHQ